MTDGFWIFASVCVIFGAPAALIWRRMEIVRKCEHEWANEYWRDGDSRRCIGYVCLKCGVKRS